MVGNVEKYVEILKGHDMKVTPQRIAILQYIDTHRFHSSAETIYAGLKENNPSLSKTTIYNSLDVLKQHGLVRTLRLGSTVRYDYNVDQHYHFWCKNCGEIIDIEANTLCWKDLMSGNHRLDDVDVYLKGVCETCLQKKRGIK